VRTVQEMHH